MIKKYKNTLGDVTGDNNTIIQINLSEDENIDEKLGVLVEKISKKEKISLNNKIENLERKLKDKSEINEYKEQEVFRLKTERANLQKEIHQKEELYASLLLELNGKDFTQTNKLYTSAYKAFFKGEVYEAIKILDRQKLLDSTLKLQREKEDSANTWLFKASLLKSKNKFTEELNECYEKAVEIDSSWGNCLNAARHFQFMHNFTKAEYYFNYAMFKAQTEYEKGITLSELAILQVYKNEYEKAITNYEAALSIYQRLVEEKPQTYSHNLGLVLHNYANLLAIKNEYMKAEVNYDEALSIMRKLSENSELVYLQSLGMVLNSLGNLQMNKKDYNKAKLCYKETLEIRRELVKINSEIYLPDLGMILSNFANLQVQMGEYEEAIVNYNGALSIYRKLVETNPQIYLQSLGMTQINISIFYQKTKVNREMSMEFIEEAIISLLPYKNVLHMQNYLKGALKVLKDWEVNVESYLKEKGIMLDFKY